MGEGNGTPLQYSCLENPMDGGVNQLEKEEMKNPRVSRRKEILKIMEEINAKETKETIAKINKAKR